MRRSPLNQKVPSVEMPGIEPGAFHMQSERATTALHPRTCRNAHRSSTIERSVKADMEAFIEEERHISHPLPRPASFSEEI